MNLISKFLLDFFFAPGCENLVRFEVLTVISQHFVANKMLNQIHMSMIMLMLQCVIFMLLFDLLSFRLSIFFFTIRKWFHSKIECFSCLIMHYTLEGCFDLVLYRYLLFQCIYLSLLFRPSSSNHLALMGGRIQAFVDLLEEIVFGALSFFCGYIFCMPGHKP